jgi:hypothetical protein
VFLLAAALAKKGLRATFPIIAVVVVALAGEILDFMDDSRSMRTWRFTASLHDLVNTAFWPMVIWLLARHSRAMN